jgi:hypothetical protein
MKMGIATYNEECRSIVQRYSKEWETIVGRMGRWIDFQNDYKTMDPSYMESVWWVFKQLFEKKLVYRGFKVRLPWRHAHRLTTVSSPLRFSTKDPLSPGKRLHHQRSSGHAMVPLSDTSPHPEG